MAIQVSWYNPEHTIVRFHYEGSWTGEDLVTAFAQARDMAACEPHRVASIADMSATRHLPTDAVRVIARILPLRPENAGPMIVVGASPMLRVVFYVFHRLHPAIEISFADTLEEAEAALLNLN